MPYESRDDLLSHKLTQEEVEELVALRRKGTTLKQLAKQYGIHENTVRNIINRYKATKGLL